MSLARLVESCDGEVTLPVGEALGVGREIGQYKERDDGPTACGGTLYNLSGSVSVAYLG